MTGWAIAVLVEIEIPPFESVDVTGTRTATGVVREAVPAAGVMTMLEGTSAGVVETTGSMSFTGSGTFGAF